MRKILFVGCGGSGGAILAYLMDQLRSDLLRYGVTQLPGGWQFVHIDVPQSPDEVAPSLGSVVDQGGRYVSCAPSTPSYSLVDAGVSQQLRNAGTLRDIATWAPSRPAEVTIPVQDGAGQRRAIGRMLILSRIGHVRQELNDAWNRMSTTESTAQMHRAARAVPTLGAFEENDTPLVLVVSSVAGGSGASMALDVCRVLSLVPGVSDDLMAVFMASADVFDSLPEHTRQGIRPNALAMLGEIIASQSGAAGRADAEVLRRLGFGTTDFVGRPFARVFPLGRTVGLSGGTVQFGDGTMGAVYRGAGRALAGLISSSTALDEFVAYDLGNPQPLGTRRELFAWGQPPENLQWGAFGFASLSMGRDRYAEYAAQRLSRSCVDHLLEGHRQAGNLAGSDQQARALVDSQWQHVCTRLELPSGETSDQRGEMLRFVRSAMTEDDATSRARDVVTSQLGNRMPNLPGGTAAQQIVATIQATLAGARTGLREEVGRTTYAHLSAWVDGLVGRFETVLDDAVSAHGLPYARTLIERLRAHLDGYVIPAMESLGRGSGDPTAVPSSVQTLLSRLKGAVAQTQTVVDEVVEAYTDQTKAQIRREWCALSGPVLRSMQHGLLDQMVASLSEATLLLEQARADETVFRGVARLETDVYRIWPSDTDQKVARRWAEANNEVLITPSSEFMPQYDRDLPRSLPDGAATDEVSAKRAVVGSIISGVWPTTGGLQAPRGLVTRMSIWRSRDLPTDPATGQPRIPQAASYDLAIRPSQLLARARLYVARPGESFQQYTMLSLRQYAEGQDISEAGRPARFQDLQLNFSRALSMALPLISVDTTAVQTLHVSQDVTFRYKFSAVPFRDLAELEARLARTITDNPHIHQGSVDNFTRALDASDATRLDIFGSYENFAPLVFDGVLRPITQQWLSAPGEGSREEFWNGRRARPLPAAIPMSDVERRTMVAGWFLGQMVGRIILPDAPYSQPVRIWSDDAQVWRPFPHPLLTPPTRFKAKFDWLPAILESSLIAIARFGEQPVGASMQPYQALRAMYDGSPGGPANQGSGMFLLSGEELVQNWLSTGTTPNGGASRVPNVTSASSPEERQAAARAWLATVESVAQRADESAQVATSREAGAALPMFVDVAEDVIWACGRLVAMLEVTPRNAGADVF